MTETQSGAAKRDFSRPVAVRRIGLPDLRAALAAGLDDFWAMPSHVIFVSLIYPILGILLATIAFGYDLTALLYPLASGFALLGPLAAVGLYELSRRRERGLPTGWAEGFEVLRNPGIGSIVAVGLLLTALFVGWLFTAQALYSWLYGPAPASVTEFLADVMTTRRGWTLIVLGNLAGLAFAAVVLAVSVVSFPLLVDRADVGSGGAVATSVRAVMANPIPMAIWGLIVASLLALGSIPLFVGLAIVLPVLGHATWHLYRRVVELPPSAGG